MVTGEACDAAWDRFSLAFARAEAGQASSREYCRARRDLDRCLRDGGKRPLAHWIGLTRADEPFACDAVEEPA
jgi:hypothetical protein